MAEAFVTPSVSTFCSLTSKGAHSVQPVATSVRTNVCTKLPLADGPLCATRSASTKPGDGLCQSEKVRTGTRRRTANDGVVRVNVRCPGKCMILRDFCTREHDVPTLML